MFYFFSFERLDSLWRLALAHALTLCLVLLNFVSFPFPYMGEVRPLFFLMAVFYWAVYRPTLMPFAFAFLIGLAMDILSGFPLGLNAFIFVAAQWFVRSQRLFLMGQSFLMLWAGFMVTALFVVFIQWSFFSIINLAVSSLWSALMEVGVSLLIFPLMSLLFISVHRLLPHLHKSLA